jgi:hypothetical protein
MHVTYNGLTLGLKAKENSKWSVAIGREKRLDPKILHQGPSPKCEKIKCHYRVATFLPNLDNIGSQKYASRIQSSSLSPMLVQSQI